MSEISGVVPDDVAAKVEGWIRELATTPHKITEPTAINITQRYSIGVWREPVPTSQFQQAEADTELTEGVMGSQAVGLLGLAQQEVARQQS